MSGYVKFRSTLLRVDISEREEHDFTNTKQQHI